MFPDVVCEEIVFPCYALFLDPANALILKPFGEWAPKGGAILTSSWLTQILKDDPKLKEDHLSQPGACARSAVDGVRVGVAHFARGPTWYGEASSEKRNEKTVNYDEKAQENLPVEGLVHVKGDESWGPVTKDDLKVGVTIY